MSKNIVVFGNKKYEELSISLIKSFDRHKDKFKFYYYTIGFNTSYSQENLIKIRLEEIENIPHPQLYKPLTFQHALTLVDDFIYFDSDMIVSRYFDYDNLLSSVYKYPKGVYIKGWDDPHWWYYDDNSVYNVFNYEEMMKYMNVKTKTQKWSSCCIVAINKTCKEFVDKWVNICMDKSLWCINESPIYKSSKFSIHAWQKYFIVGEETPYNLMLWLDNVQNYYYEDVVLEPKKIETIVKIENGNVKDTNFEPEISSSYCKSSDIIVAYHQLKDVKYKYDIIDALKSKDCLKFGIYTSFYNAEKFIDYIFNEVAKINYNNFEWIITDDFSKDKTKDLLLEKIKDFKNVKYVEQSYKKEMYWQPNKFFNKTFDYIVLIDCDDGFDYEFLNLYNIFALKYPEAVLITSDFIKTSDGSKHSFSLLKNDRTILEKLNTFHPQTDYINNISYNALGHLRCFKNIENLKFEIDDFDACAEDSYRVMYMNNIGKWLHIPRCLYDWKLRSDSESHSSVKDNFNGNFQLAYNKIQKNCYEPYYDFNDIYDITSSLSILGINNINKTSFSIFSEYLNNEQKNKIQTLFPNCFFNYNQFNNEDNLIIIYDKYNSKDIINNLILKVKSTNHATKIVLYYFEKSFAQDIDDLNLVLQKNINDIQYKLNNFNYSYFLYYRHNYFIL